MKNALWRLFRTQSLSTYVDHFPLKFIHAQVLITKFNPKSFSFFSSSFHPPQTKFLKEKLATLISFIFTPSSPLLWLLPQYASETVLAKVSYHLFVQSNKHLSESVLYLPFLWCVVFPGAPVCILNALFLAFVTPQRSLSFSPLDCSTQWVLPVCSLLAEM